MVHLIFVSGVRGELSDFARGSRIANPATREIAFARSAAATFATRPLRFAMGGGLRKYKKLSY